MKERVNLGILFFILIFLFIFYQMYLKSSTSVTFTYEEMKKFLENRNDDNRIRKPILWIHLNYEVNCRKWENFYSRKTHALNQGYVYLTIKTIIDRCKHSFHICLIDDNTFDKLNSCWLPKHKNVADPLKTYFRFLSKCKLLHNYGGLFVPASFICFRDLIDMYSYSDDRIVMNPGKRFLEDTSCFLSCHQNSPKMHVFIQYLHKSILKEGFGSNSIYFNSKLDGWMNKTLTYIDGKQIGMKTKGGEKITLEMLMSSNYLSINKDIFGILIPQGELLQRIQYGWFPRLSPEQVLESNIIISKYLLLACVENQSEFRNFFQLN